MTSRACYVEWCQLGHHTGGHSATAYVAPPTTCAPARCYCTRDDCPARFSRRPMPSVMSDDEREQRVADWEDRRRAGWKRGDGAHRKQRGMGVASQGELAWQDRYVRAFAALVLGGQPFTSEDVTERVGIPEGRPNAVGAATNAALRQAATRGIQVKRLGYVTATRANQHASRIAQYKGEV